MHEKGQFCGRIGVVLVTTAVSITGSNPGGQEYIYLLSKTKIRSREGLDEVSTFMYMTLQWVGAA
jgi:hypothetical protein